MAFFIYSIMKCPIEIEEIDQILEGFKEEEKRKQYFLNQEERYKLLQEGKMDKNEVFKGTFYDLLFEIYTFENSDPECGIKNYNRDFIQDLFKPGLYTNITLNDFIIAIKKPNTLGEMTKIKRAILVDLDYNDRSDIIAIQKAVGKDILAIADKNSKEINDIENLGYLEASIFYFFSPVIFQIFLLYINSLGSITKKN